MTRWRRWLLGLIVAGAVIGLAGHVSELRNFALLVERAEPAWLLIALLLQLSTYLCLALAWRTVLFASEKTRRPLKPLVRIALSKLFADQAIPTAGMAGNVIVVDQLVTMGASRGTAVAALLVSMLGFYSAYALYAVGALIFLWLHGHATPLMVGLVTSFIIVACAIPALALWLRHRGSKPLPRTIEHIRPIRQLLQTMSEAPARLLRNRRLLLQVGALNALLIAADILTLHVCLLSMGCNASIATALIAFILASIVVTLGPIPFGLGSFEVTCVSIMAMLGVAVEAAIASTLLLRALTLWLPLIPGLWQFRSMSRQQNNTSD